MTTKTSKPKTETPVTPPAVSPSGDNPPADAAAPTVEPDGLLTEAERRELLERLTPERRAMLSGMVDGLHRMQFLDEMAESSKRREAKRQHKLAYAKEITADKSCLNDLERLTLHLIGALAMNYDVPRASVYEGGLESLFNNIVGALREGLTQVDFDQLKALTEAERAGISTVPTWGRVESDDVDDDADEVDGDE